MAKKSEVVAQKKDKHENRNAVIVGLLLALLSIIILLLIFYFGPSYTVSSCVPTPNEPWSCTGNCCPPPNNDNPNMTCCMAGHVARPWVGIYVFIPYIYGIYFLLGVVLYLASMRFDKEGRLKLRFWGKSFFVGGVIGILLFVTVISSIFGVYESIFGYPKQA